MDNKIALERMKQLLYDISTKNEALNKDNNDLNIKITSLIKLLKAKDNQLENNKKLLLKYILKNIFYKKYIKEQQSLKIAFNNFKNIIDNNNFKNIIDNNNGYIKKPTKKLFYSHENDIFLPTSKKYNYTDIGIGDFKINYKFYVRRVACLTLLKRRKYIMNIDENNFEKSNGQDNGYKLNLIFKNMLPQNKVIDFSINSNRIKNKKRNFDFSVFHMDIIDKNNNKEKKFDKNILKSENIYNNYTILSDRNSESSRILKEKYDKEINNYVETIKIIEIDNNNLKLQITQKDEEISKLEIKCKNNESQIKSDRQEKEELKKEINNIKNQNLKYKKKIDDYALAQKKISEYENKYKNLNNRIKNKKLEIKIDKLNKLNINIISERKNKENFIINKIIKINNINIIGKNKINNSSFNNILPYNNKFFKIITKNKKKLILKKFSFSFNIIYDHENSSLMNNSKNNINFKTKHEKKKNLDTELDVIEPLKYDLDDYKHTLKYFEILESSNNFSLNFIGKPKKIIKNFDILESSKTSNLKFIKKPKINKYKLKIFKINSFIIGKSNINKNRYKFFEVLESSKTFNLKFINKTKINKNKIKFFEVLESSNTFSLKFIKKQKINKNKQKISNMFIPSKTFNLKFIKKPKINKIKNNFFEGIKYSNSFNLIFKGKPRINKNNIELIKISKSSSLNIIEKNNQKDEIINNLKSSLFEIDKKNNNFKIIILDLKIKYIFYLKNKFHFFIKLISVYFQNKITNSFKMFRSLLIKLKMKSILKIIINGSPKYFFLKYYFEKYKYNSLYISLLINKNELLNNIEQNNKLNSQINLFQETFKKYEESNSNEKKEKDNIITKQKSLINSLNDELSQVKNNFEKMKKTAKDSAAELISTSNEQNKQRKIIEKLNEEIKELQDNKIGYENQIKSQQELIKNLNEKIKKDQFEYEQNEQDVSVQIEKLKTQFNEYENSINNLNNQNINLQKENEKLKLNNENLNNNKEELMQLIQNNKNYEKENENLRNQNEELKINNESLNSQYIILKKDFDNLKVLSEESKAELSKAMNEMESYSELLMALEMKVKEAENQKNIAENERDKAINDVKEIRQRYINIMGEKYA